jgi:sugar/nucleoside kinase (ribokinase family)
MVNNSFNKEIKFLKPEGTVTCTGAGLIALDIIVNGSPSTPAKLCAGGTCGNVLSILSFLGWESNPIARLRNNGAYENLCKDLKQFDVKTALISNSQDGSTPVIIHRILKDKMGKPKHKFEFKVPETGAWLPQYKPVLKLSVDSIVNIQPKSNVFFFDRVSRSTVELAKHYKEQGSLIVFEPSSLKTEKNFLEALSIAHVVKFSNERIHNYDQVFSSPIADLEIETLGKEGLRYRLKSSKKIEWIEMTPYLINNAVDSAGAGDWCTAGIINQLGYNGAKSFYSATNSSVENALEIGQALGALNCSFFGARGIMYNINYNSMIEYVNAIMNRDQIKITEHNSKW